MASNTAVNFAFGAAEGAFIGVVTAINPVAGLFALLFIGGVEYFSGFRETTKDAINSLD